MQTTSFQQLMESDRKRYERNCSICDHEIIYFHKSKDFGKPEVCPKCGDTYWDKPIIEVELFKIQDRYVVASPEERTVCIGQMYEKLIEYAEHMIKSIMKSKKILSKEELEMAAHDATAIMLQRFLEKEDYVTRISFGGNLKKILSGVLFGGARNDAVLSLDYSKNGESNFGDFVTDEDEIFEIEDGYIEDFDSTNKFEDTGLTTDITTITGQFSDEIRDQDQAGSILFLAGVYNTYLKKNKQSMSMFYVTAGSEIKQALDYYQLYIRNYLKNGASFEHHK